MGQPVDANVTEGIVVKEEGSRLYRTVVISCA
jgi:hypothetical protein